MPGCSIKPPCRLDLVVVLSICAFCTQAASLAQQQQSGPIRFFFDEGYFLEGETEIVRAYIAASNNRLEISGESTAAFLSVKGYYVPEKWDVYWTVRRSCHMAFPLMQPGQLVNCIPGVEAMSLKRTFIQTWQQAYGELAFNYIPRSYLLPEQYWLWRSHILAAAAAADSKWVLKANVHRGKGVQVVMQNQALSQALLHKAGSSSSSSSGGIEYHNVLIQQYCEPQMVIAGRSSYIRVWLLVTNITPLRAYLFKGGFAIFGKHKGNATAGTDAAAAGSSGSGISNDDFIVNLWIQDRGRSPIWSLDQLEKYLDKHPEVVLPLPLEQAGSSGSSSSSSSSRNEGSAAAAADKSQQQGKRTFADAWKDIQAQSSLVLAAALPAMRAAAANSSAPDSGMFEYFGIDFVFDAYLRPWMLEVNAVPSMARRKRSGCAGSKSTDNCQLNTMAAAAASSSSSSSSSKQVRGAADAADDFDEQKEQFVHDMMVLLGVPVDAPLAAAATSVYNSSSSSSSNQGQKSLPKPKNGLELLQLAAAAVKGAEMSSSSNAGTAAGSRGGSGGNTARLLLSHKKRISHLWRTGFISQATAAASTPTSSRSSSSATARIQQHQLRLLQQQTVRHKRHRHHHRPSPGAVAAATAAAAARAADAAQRLDHQHDHQLAISLSDLPKSLHPLLCPTTSSSSSSSERSGSESFGCVSCLTAADLAAVAAAETELQRAGQFVPVYDLIQAHKLNSMAAGHQAAVGGGRESQPAAASSSGNDAGSSSSSSSVQEAAVAPGAEYLSSDRSVWQKLYDTWTGLSTKGVGLRDLGIMKYYTSESEVKAAVVLELNRQDYVMSAWLRVRQKQQQQGGCLTCSSSSEGGVDRGPGVDCVILMLQQLVKECYNN